MRVKEVGEIAALRKQLGAKGGWCELDLQGCRNKAELMQRSVDCMQLADGFGRNWDALYDALRDHLMMLSERGDAVALVVVGVDELTMVAPQLVSILRTLLVELEWPGQPESCVVYWLTSELPTETRPVPE